RIRVTSPCLSTVSAPATAFRVREWPVRSIVRQGPRTGVGGVSGTPIGGHGGPVKVAPGGGSVGVNGKAGVALQGGRQGIPAGHPEVCRSRSPGVPGLGSGPRKTGGGEEGVPLGGWEGQVAAV